MGNLNLGRSTYLITTAVGKGNSRSFHSTLLDDYHPVKIKVAKIFNVDGLFCPSCKKPSTLKILATFIFMTLSHLLAQFWKNCYLATTQPQISEVSNKTL